jgi:thiamine pyrophosphate-dependent acetolactate synthase large subunit-like protein
MGVMVTVATALVDLLAEAEVRRVFGVPSGPEVPVVPARTLDEARAAIARGWASDGPLIVEAWVDPSEYDEVILRPHK